MAKNFIQSGDRMTYTAAATILGGAGVLIGATFGVNMYDVVSGDSGELGIKGVWNLPKVTLDDVVLGALLYWDDTAKKLTLTASGNSLVAKAHAAAGTTATTVDARLIDVKLADAT